MKKHLHFMKNEKGFYLPVVLIVSIIALSTIITTTHIYKNEMEATNLLRQHLDLSTMREITMKRFKNEINYVEHENGAFEFELENIYSYGDYEVIDGIVHITFFVETDQLSYEYDYAFEVNDKDEE